MRSNRRPCVTRSQPVTLNHVWWTMEEISTGIIRDVASGEPMLVVNPNSYWSIISGGIEGNRASKSTQGGDNFIYTEAKLTDLDLLQDLCMWAFVWPESSDLNSDQFTRAIFGQPGWLSLEAGLNISVYFTGVNAGVSDGKGNSSAMTGYTTFGTIGALHLFILQYDSKSRKIMASHNGASFTTASTALPSGPANWTRTRFNLGSYVRRSVVNSDVTNLNNRDLRGKFDNVGYMKGKLISNADASWLWNSGAGRSYQDAVDYGLFRGGSI